MNLMTDIQLSKIFDRDDNLRIDEDESLLKGAALLVAVGIGFVVAEIA